MLQQSFSIEMEGSCITTSGKELQSSLSPSHKPSSPPSRFYHGNVPLAHPSTSGGAPASTSPLEPGDTFAQAPPSTSQKVPSSISSQGRSRTLGWEQLCISALALAGRSREALACTVCP